MTQTSNRFYDRFAQLMNDAANVAQGVRREATTMFKSQAERMANDMDLVKREDFDAVKEMAQNAREENARLEARIAALEAQLASAASASGADAASATGSAGRKTTARGRSSASKTAASGAKSTGEASRAKAASSASASDESAS